MEEDKSMDNQKLDINEMLGNEATISEENGIRDEKIFPDEENVNVDDIEEKREDDRYVYVHSGRAMTERELLHFSAKNKVNMVMVAGPFESGKTTLLVMMYYLYREGLNKITKFKSSYTMQGYWERSQKLLLNSGNASPNIDRTSRDSQDLFLNLSLLDEKNRLRNLVFSDISGEVFNDPSFLNELPDYFLDCENVLLILDGEKIGNIMKRRSAIHEITIMMNNLIKHNFVTTNTNLQVICTKNDWIKKQPNSEEIETYVDKQYEKLKKTYASYVERIKFYKISALNLSDINECNNLEQVIRNCFEESCACNEINEEQEVVLNRAFEYYGLRK